MTNATTIATTELDSIYENAIIFHRENRARVTFSVQHYGACHEVTIAIYVPDEPLDETSDDIRPHERPIEDEPKARVTLSYAEAKVLCNLLNRPQVAVQLEQE